MKRLLSFFLSAALMITTFGLTASANVVTSPEDEISPQYAYTQSISSGLSISNLKASCTSVVIGNSSKTTKIYLTQTLQKNTGSSWRNVITSSKTSYSNVCFLLNTFGVSSGKFRVKTVAKVYSGSNYETLTAYSSKVSC